ncbi:MAG: phosphotransferase [Methylococcaceae bacterium]|nr:phosphotransferase [Methylococcaceae bacterium]
MQNNELLIQHLANETGQSLKNITLTPVYGGDINHCYHLKANNISWFIKLNDAELEAMFVAEAAGLKELSQTKTLKIPEVITYGNNGQQSYLVLEYLSLGKSSSNSDKLLGRQLAQLHRQKQPFYGWHIDNTIGKTPQHNQRNDDWVTFWQQQRLAKQLQLAAQNGHRGKLQSQGEKLCANIGKFFSNYQPQASVVHGDLWGGNAAVDMQGNPVIFDPACYYADREVDLAMTELFGGYSHNFYAAYEEEWALDEGYNVRKTLYNLYHILNHLNLFGRGYASQASGMISKLLAEL